jgi:hypothetical protein
MIEVLIVYFIMMPDRHWEFMAIEHTNSLGYCRMLQDDLSKAYSGTPGNMRVICTDDEGGEA